MFKLEDVLAMKKRDEEAKNVYWLSPLTGNCQLCNGPYNKTMYDANLRGVGWGNFCHSCFTDHRGTLGTGRGQKYTKQADGRWLKVGG